MSSDLFLIHRTRDLSPAELAAAVARLELAFRVEAFSVEEGSYDVELGDVSVAVKVSEPITAADFGGEPLDEDDRENLDADPRKHAYVLVSARSWAWPMTCAVGARLAVALDARPYDAQTGEWLELHTMDIRELRAWAKRED